MFCFHWKLFIPPDNDLNCDHQDERKRKKEKAPEKDIRHFHVSPLRFPKAFLFSTGHSSVCIVFVFVCLFVLKNPLIHFSSCFAQKANTAVNPFCPESLPAFPEASLLIQWPPPSLPLRLASLSEPTATTALPLLREEATLWKWPCLFCRFLLLGKAQHPGGRSPSSGFPPAENWFCCPLVNQLAVTMTTAWPRARVPDLTPLPASPKSVWVPAAFVGLRFACQFEAALLLIGCRGLGLESLGCREVSSLPWQEFPGNLG